MLEEGNSRGPTVVYCLPTWQNLFYHDDKKKKKKKCLIKVDIMQLQPIGCETARGEDRVTYISCPWDDGHLVYTNFNF